MNIKTIVIVCAVAVALLSYRFYHFYSKAQKQRLCFEQVARAPAERWNEEAKKCAEGMAVFERTMGINKPGP